MDVSLFDRAGSVSRGLRRKPAGVRRRHPGRLRDGEHLGKITTANVIRGINTIRGPVVNAAKPWEIETSAIHLDTFNDGTVSGTSVRDLVGGATGTLVNGATVRSGTTPPGPRRPACSRPATTEMSCRRSSRCCRRRRRARRPTRFPARGA